MSNVEQNSRILFKEVGTIVHFKGGWNTNRHLKGVVMSTMHGPMIIMHPCAGEVVKNLKEKRMLTNVSVF